MDEIIDELKIVLDINTKPYLTIQEASTLLNVSRNTIEDWIVHGLKIIKWGERSTRIKKSDLDEYLEKFKK